MISKNNKQQKTITDSITQLPTKKHFPGIPPFNSITTPLNHLSQLANKILYPESKYLQEGEKYAAVNTASNDPSTSTQG